MKNLIKITLAIFFSIALNSCSSQNNISSEKVNMLLKTSEFTFMAERANPISNDVINVLNAFPNSSSSQILNLDYGYTLEIKRSEIKVDLPYFGRMYTPSFDNEKNSYHFTSKDFTIAEQNGKKGSSVYTINLKDQQNVKNIMLEVYKNGKAYLSIQANDRQSISYDGYIMANILSKK